MSRLPSSGYIDMAQVNVELRRPWNQYISLGDGQVHWLMGYPEGQRHMSQLWGKQLYQDAGLFLGYYCANFHKYGTFADGNGGAYGQVVEYNSPYCGYTAPPPVNNNPPNGTVIEQYCSGNALVTIYADGNGGTWSSTDNGSPACQIDWGGQG